MQIKMATLLNVTKNFRLKKTGKYGELDLCLQSLKGMVSVGMYVPGTTVVILAV
jgi:hypothetical protein